MITLPPKVDRTPRGKWVKCADFGTKEYVDNECFTLMIEHDENGIVVRYEGDGDYMAATPKDIQKIIKLFNP